MALGLAGTVSAGLSRVNRVPHAFLIDTPAPGEASRLAQVHLSSWRETYGVLVPDRFLGAAALEQRTEFWRRLLSLESSPYASAVACAPEGIVGLAMAGPVRPPEGFAPRRPEQLFILYVLAAWHGGGVGQALLDHTLGTRPAELWVARHNPRARAFYARNGFEPDGDERVDEDLDGLEEIRMVRGRREDQ